MIHPGPWQNYKNRPDNKKLTTEELTYKYKQELLVHENFNYQQVQIQHQDNQGKRAPASSTSLLDYPGFVGGPYTKFKANTGIQIGGNVQSFPNGILNQSQINTIITQTATGTHVLHGFHYQRSINSFSELTVGERFLGYPGNGGDVQNMVTSRNIVQDGTDIVLIATDGIPYTSGALEYIITYATNSSLGYNFGEIIDIYPFIVP